jgi:hypothetical protein
MSEMPCRLRGSADWTACNLNGKVPVRRPTAIVGPPFRGDIWTSASHEPRTFAPSRGPRSPAKADTSINSPDQQVVAFPPPFRREPTGLDFDTFHPENLADAWDRFLPRAAIAIRLPLAFPDSFEK